MYANARGITGKINSLKGVINTLKPHVFGIVETHKNVDTNVLIEDYIWIGRPRKKKQGGGIGFLILKDIEKYVSIHKVEEGENEKMWIQYKQKKNKDLYLGLYYGKQESRTPKETIEDELNQIGRDIMNIKQNDGEVLLMGDFNIKLIDERSRDSDALRQLVDDLNMVIINETEKCEGQWTRVNTKRQSERSVIDYIITTQDMYNEVLEMKVDEDECYKLSGKNPSDHNTIILNTMLAQQQSIKEKREVKWRITNKTEWTKYRQKLKENMNRIWRTTQHEEIQYSQMVKNKKDSAFCTIGKTTVKERKQYIDQRVENAKTKKNEAKINLKKAKGEQEVKIRKDELMREEKKLVEIRTEVEAEKTESKIKSVLQKYQNDKNVLWKIKKSINTNEKDKLYLVKDQEGNRIYEPDGAKEVIAQFYERQADGIL